MTSRNVGQHLSLLAKRSITKSSHYQPSPSPSPSIILPPYYNNKSQHHYQNRRSKSSGSIPFLTNNTTENEIYERASHNAASFDAHYHLTKQDTLFSTWRQRQKSSTLSNPVKPYPRKPVQLLHPPDASHPPSFFPPYAHSGHIGPPSLPHDHVLIHDSDSISRMRKAAQLARQLLDKICSPHVAKAGMTTEAIDEILRSAALECGAYPSPLNYHSFPKSVCSSINEVVCHGIPDQRPLELGDVVSFDVSCYLDGVHGDNCATVIIGDVQEEDGDDCDDADDCGAEEEKSASSSPSSKTLETHPSTPQKDWPSKDNNQLLHHLKTHFSSDEEEEKFVTARRLVQSALEARDEGVAACKPGGCLSEVGGAIHAVSDAYGYDTVRHYRGHGISSDFHCAPFVKHFRNTDTMELLPGMIFTIEPMITEGSAECHEWSDNWTVVTQDGGRAAQFEHTVLITETGVEILTLPP
eukprot:CAMPEP_0183762942 /NCGR_PEP_ID=MMETSP0739-20130205/9379_1 /TAXON_ID=385413 /ORGANISM="Thalassiosira miniscula, Strain CCMP1093" /LENGTH=467 /DNA_ID=CAMNT_0026001281 /DNA_START=430 /DNA_END=1833 /DNA_ORIENTATION=+